MTEPAPDWWQRSTVEARLAQIDGGIDCGMTSAQVAMCLRTTPSNVRTLASSHGRGFPASNLGSSYGNQRRNSVMRDRSAYLRGERVNLWGEDRQDEFALDAVTE